MEITGDAHAMLRELLTFFKPVMWAVIAFGFVWVIQYPIKAWRSKGGG